MGSTLRPNAEQRERRAASERRRREKRRAGLATRRRRASVRFDARTRGIFLEELARHGLVTHAARAALLTPETCYRHRRIDAEFALQWEEAVQGAADALEAEARRRAVEG